MVKAYLQRHIHHVHGLKEHVCHKSEAIERAGLEICCENPCLFPTLIVAGDFHYKCTCAGQNFTSSALITGENVLQRHLINLCTTEVTNLALASGRLSENNSRLKPLPEDGRQVEEEPLDAQDERDIDCGKNTIIIMYSFCMG